MLLIKNIWTWLNMDIIKIQRRATDTVIGIPATVKKNFETAEYLICTADEHGLHYTPVEAK